MRKLSNKPAFPRPESQGHDGRWRDHQEGMTYREHLVAEIVKGFCANPAIFAHNPKHGWGLVNCTEGQLSNYAAELADATIKTLEEITQ